MVPGVPAVLLVTTMVLLGSWGLGCFGFSSFLLFTPLLRPKRGNCTVYQRLQSLLFFTASGRVSSRRSSDTELVGARGTQPSTELLVA